MPIFTQIDTSEDNPLGPAPQSTLGEELGATFKSAVTEGPVGQIWRLGKLSVAQYGSPYQSMLGGGPDIAPSSPVVTADEARAKVKDAGLQLDIPDSGIRQEALDLLIQHKQDQANTEATISRGPGGIGAGALRFGASFAGSLMDPLGDAAMLIPGVGEERAAAMMANAGSFLGRTAVRAGVGAAAGAAGTAALQPLTALAAHEYQDQYGIADALKNVAWGSALGGGLHAGIGALSDAFSRGEAPRPQGPLPAAIDAAPPETRKAALQTSLGQVLSGRSVDVEPILGQPITMSGQADARFGDELRATPQQSEAGIPATAIDPTLTEPQGSAAHDGYSDFGGDLAPTEPSLPVEPIRRNETRLWNPVRPEELQARARASFQPEAQFLYDREAVRAGDGAIAKAPADEAMPEASLQEHVEELQRAVAAVEGGPPPVKVPGVEKANEAGAKTPASRVSKKLRPLTKAQRVRDMGPEGAMPAKPVLEMLKAASGVDPQSPLAGELRHMGITTKTLPGLFKKGGLTAVDNFVASEHDLFNERGFAEEHNGYVPTDEVLAAIRDEMHGSPRRTADQQEQIDAFWAQSRQRDYERQTLEDIGVDTTGMTDAQVAEHLADWRSKEDYFGSIPPPASEEDYRDLAAMVAQELEMFSRQSEANTAAAESFGKGVAAYADCILKMGL